MSLASKVKGQDMGCASIDVEQAADLCELIRQAWSAGYVDLEERGALICGARNVFNFDRLTLFSSASSVLLW